MRQRKGLKRDAEAIMRWQRESRERAARKKDERKRAPDAPYSSLRRSDGLKRGGGPGKDRVAGARRLLAQRPEPVGPLSPAAWREEVWRLCGRRSIISGVPVRLSDGKWVWQAHHPLPKRYLPPELKYHPDNGVVLLTQEHARHEHWFIDRDGTPHVIALEKLPERAVRFAAELGDEYLELLHRHHPPAVELEQRTPRGGSSR